MLLIVAVGQRLLAVSSAKDGVRLLCELSPQDIPDLAETRPPDSPDDNSTFGKRFVHNMRVNMKLTDAPHIRPPTGDAASDSSSPGPFALALLKAQADGDRDGLLSLLNKTPDPTSVPADRTEASGHGAVQDYNAAIESLKMMSHVGDAPSRTPQVVPISSNAAAAAYSNPAPSREVVIEEKVDELFDKISKRSTRYTKKE
jgi:hypothetical protein